MIAPCIDCGQETGLVDAADFYFRCPDHISTDWYNVGNANIPLTPRELQVAMLVADGLTNHDISQELNLTYGRVRNLVSQCIRKLDVADRRAINRALRRYGL